MSNRNNYRKCAKCHRTRAEDVTVTYHRFPNPGAANITKARAWAKYCWPNEDWGSLEFLKTLYNKNKVLCGRHFHSSQFYDNQRQKLNKFAVPDITDIENQNMSQPAATTTDNPRSAVPLSVIENTLHTPSINESTSMQQSFVDVPSTSKSTYHKQVQKVKSLSTRRLNQDPLENCFGCIQYHCGSNTNPTISQFVAGIKTAINTNLRHSGQNTNCEDDSATLANNLLPFLTSNLEQEQQTYTEHTVSADNVETLLANTVEAMDQATPEGQACAYICGFIFKKLRHNECKDCLNIYVTKNIEAIHIFTSFKEYETSNTSLNYMNKNVVVCVEKCAIVINNYLKNNAHTPQIRTNIMTSLGSVDFSFLNTCVNHFESNKRHIQNSIFYICVKRYIIIKNREMDEDEKKRALERKMKILQNK